MDSQWLMKDTVVRDPDLIHVGGSHMLCHVCSLLKAGVGETAEPTDVV